MLESLFRFLFEYRPVVFQQGEFRFAPTTGSYLALAVALIAAGLIIVSYTRAGVPDDAGPRARRQTPRRALRDAPCRRRSRRRARMGTRP